MEVLDPRSALLSNFEVLMLLKELESDQLALAKTALRIKKEETHIDEQHAKSNQPLEEVGENLRTVEVEAIQYLSADYQPTATQDNASITQLVKALGSYDLTTAEKLQIVNLAPTEPVELYVIVEELEDRLEDKMPDVLDLVRRSLAEGTRPHAADGTLVDSPGRDTTSEEELQYPYEMGSPQTLQGQSWYEDAGHELFVDTGEGAGVEGDLELEEE